MERGLLWLPLLIIFGILAYLGWVDYQKVEAYRHWARHFEQTKYDVLAVLGLQGQTLTWGRPERQGPTQLYSVSLTEVTDIQLSVDQNRFSWPTAQPPQGQTIQLVLLPQDHTIPFTDLNLAVEWWAMLKKKSGI